jgi:hypothetical protein
VGSFFAWPLVAQALTICAAFAAVIVIITLGVGRLRPAWVQANLSAVSPATLTPQSILLSLLVGFLASNVWANFERASNMVSREAQQLDRMLTLAEALDGSLRSAIGTAVGRYIRVDVSEEWRQMRQGIAPSRAVPADLLKAQRAIVAHANARDGQRIATGMLLAALHEALDARSARIDQSGATIAPLKWMFIIALSILTLIQIAIVHAKDHTARAITLGVFGAGLSVAFTLLVAFDRPFRGDYNVSPEPLTQLLHTIDGARSGALSAAP